GPEQVDVPRRRGRPLVALLLGSTPQLLDPAVRGVLGAGADAIVAEGDAAELPDELRVDPGVHPLGVVDAAALLRRVDAAVHHGGSGSIVTCLQAEVPSVAIP